MSGDQPMFDDMPVRLWPVTPTKVLTWTDCPRRWRFTYLERRPKGPPWAHNSVGSSVHNALREWYSGPRERRTPEGADAAVRRGWISDGFPDDALSAHWRDRAAAMVVRYVEGLDPDDEPVGVERTVATRTATLAISGRVDRIDRRSAPDDVAVESGRDDELVIVDYKTGRRALTDDDARSSIALALYAVAAARVLRTPCTKVELHHLPTDEVLVWRHTDESLARAVRRVESIAIDARAAETRWRDGGLAAVAEREGRRDGDGRVTDDTAAAEVDAVFPPTVSAGCGWCDVRRWCAEGQAAAAAQPPWSGLADG